MINVLLNIDGTDYLTEERVSINKVISDYNTISKFTAKFFNDNGDLSSTFNLNEDILIKSDIDINPPTTNIFRGIIEDITFFGEENKEILQLSGRDYGAILQDIIVSPRIFKNTEAGEIVKSLMRQNATGTGVTHNNVETTSTTIKKITFNGVSLFDAIRKIAEISGFYFFVDEDKDLNFKQKENDSSGLTFGTVPMSDPIAHYKMNDNAANTTVVDGMGSFNGVSIRNTDQLSIEGKIISGLNFNGVGGDTPEAHWKFNDITGSVFADSANGFTGSTVSQTGSTTGIVGSAITCDGSDVRFGTAYGAGSPNFISGAMTVSTWVKVGDYINNQHIVDHYDWRFTTSSDPRMNWTVGRMASVSGPTFTATALNTTAGSWEHFVGTYNPQPDSADGDIKIYRNGSLADTTDIGSNTIYLNYNNGRDLFFGNSDHGVAVGLSGCIDETRIYDKILTDADITSLYNEGAGTEDNSDYVDLGTLPVGLGVDFSFGGWVNLKSFRQGNDRQDQRMIIGGQHGSQVTLSIQTNGTVLFRRDDPEVVSNGTISLNEWTHIFATYKVVGDGNVISKIYINGVLDKEDTSPIYSGAQTSTRMWIGWDSRFENVWDGKLDDIRVYDLVLTTAEITSIYNRGQGTESQTPEDTVSRNVLAATFQSSDDDIFNEVKILGGRQETFAQEEFITGTDNTGSVYTLSAKPYNVGVQLSGTPNLLYQPGGILNISNPATDTTQFLVDFQGQEVILTSGTTAGDNTVPNGSVIIIDFFRSTPLIKTLRDETSIATYGLKKKEITNKNIIDLNEATDVAETFIAEHKDPKIVGNMEILGVLNVIPGETCVVNIPNHNQDSQTYSMIKANYIFNKRNNHADRVLQLTVNKKVEDFTDLVKDHELRLRSLEVSEVESSITNFELFTGSIGISGTVAIIQKSIGSAFYFNVTGHDILESPSSLLGLVEGGSTVITL